jgi:peptide/nickel transport system substrate-binding protein
MTWTKKRGGRFAACAVVLLALVAAACGSDSTSDSSSDDTSTQTTAAPLGTDGAATGGKVVVDWATGNTTLDPAAACNQDDLSLVSNLYVQLTKPGTKPGPDGTQQYDPTVVEPYFAESWEVSPDGLTYTFTLPAGVTFADGTPVDAAAVKYSADRVMAMGTCATFYLQAGMSAPPVLQSVEAPDPTTVVYRLARPNGDFLLGLATPAGSIVNPTLVEANGGVQDKTPNQWMAANVAGSGPFVLQDYQPNTKAVLVANPDFFGEPPLSDEIEINYITSASTLQLRAESGDADVTLGLPLQGVKELEGDDCCRIIANDAPMFAQVALQNATAPFDDPQVREALALAIPYEDVLESVAFGYGQLFYGPIVPNAVGFSEEASPPLEVDLDRARQLLAESGVATPIDVELIINGANPFTEQLATVVQGIWQQLGVNVTIQKLAASDFTPRFTQGSYQAALITEGPGVPTAGYQLMLGAYCTSNFNNAKVCIEGGDALIDQAMATSDPDEAQELYDEFTELWRAQHPRVMLFSMQNVAVLGPDVTSYYFAKFYDFTRWATRP